MVLQGCLKEKIAYRSEVNIIRESELPANTLSPAGRRHFQPCYSISKDCSQCILHCSWLLNNTGLGLDFITWWLIDWLASIAESLGDVVYTDCLNCLSADMLAWRHFRLVSTGFDDLEILISLIAAYRNNDLKRKFLHIERNWLN